jgi:hypothetical protein
MKIKLLLLSSALFFSSAMFAAPNGPDANPWKASADIAGSSGQGIVVTDTTYAACVTQFQNAMDSHSYYHGDVFVNIQYCQYRPAGTISVGKYELMQLSDGMIDLENSYNINEYNLKKEALLTQYENQVEVLPPVPRKEIIR